MQIISKFKVNGVTGYIIDEGDDVKYPVSERGLYEKDIIEGLTASGYKFFDYHFNIVTPNGVPIQDIVEKELDGSSLDEVQSFMDMDAYVLDEASASAYFSREVVKQITKFKEPKVEIKTREELLNYLDKCKALQSKSKFIRDPRPLNSFVAKEALFTIDELSSREVREYMRIIESRRRLQDYSQFKILISFLQKEGVLGQKYTADDIIDAYLSWGLCGIKTPCTGMRVKKDAYADIFSKSEAASALDKSAGRVKEYCLVDRHGIIHYDGGSVDLSDVEVFANEDVMPEHESDYLNLIRTNDSWDCDYKYISCFVRHYKTRRYFEFTSESGIICEARCDDSNIVIMDISGNVIFSQSFMWIGTMDESFAKLNDVCTELDFQKYNILRAKARDIYQQKTRVPIVDSTFDLMLREGVGPDSAIKYIADKITNDVNADMRTDIDYTKAYKIYRNGPDASLIKKYNPMNYEYETLDELIEIMLATRDEMEAEGRYLVVDPNDNSSAGLSTREEILTRPLENLEFAKLITSGAISIGYLKLGQERDGDVDIPRLMRFINLIIRLEYGSEVFSNMNAFKNAVKNIENSRVFNIFSLIGMRDKAFFGALRDRAELNAARAKESTQVVYITKVFRELSNNKESRKRHYMFECLSLDNSGNNKQEASHIAALESAYIRGVNNAQGLTEELQNILRIEAPSIAFKLAFKLVRGTGNIETSGDSFVITERLNIGEEIINIRVEIPSGTYYHYKSGESVEVKYSTLYDWTYYETSSNTAFNLYCVNAGITPWRVIPAKGVEIPEYNFIVNYLSKDVFKNYSDGFKNQMAEWNAKVIPSIGGVYFTQSVMENDTSFDVDDLSSNFTVDVVDYLLNEECDELVDGYYKRWILHNNDARSKGQFLCDMRLKTDEVYASYAGVCGEQIFTEETYKEINGKDGAFYITDMKPALLTNKSQIASISSGNQITPFDFREQDLQDIMRWDNLTLGRFNPKGINIYSAGKLAVIINNQKRILDVANMTLAEAEQEALDGVLMQLDANTFLIKAINGMFSVLLA